ncbi:MAG: hypothetical protein LUG99_18650 [Lachnospiraceae bacterium]|nr:hypothetical protein [Lachnospiraceae bacterium]
MIHDENLISAVDYSAGQKEAAHRVLIELVNLFQEYEDDIRIVGGWVPDLMFPKAGHIGSVDVDILINHLTLQDEGYQNMSRILRRNAYEDHPDKYFSFIKTINVDGVLYDVDVDILAGMYGGTQQKKRSQHVQGIIALIVLVGVHFSPQYIRAAPQNLQQFFAFSHFNVPPLLLQHLVMIINCKGSIVKSGN